MRKLMILSCFAFVACSETSSGGFHTRNGVRVAPVNAQVFEVSQSPSGVGEADFWCGAGDYARRMLGAKDSERVYVVSEAGPGVVAQSNSTVQFSMSPPEQTQGALGRVSSWGPKIGTSSSVVRSASSCRTPQNRD
ncbi:hypothetical protein CLV88_10476 [Shimia abyssi]|uniref:Uncharacterized protein n=1 Tax=Shimia abyssi TaxID=1662395 RepID=A0A2P8FE77_9RHOB|nr:hypothetical protein CLV88_10476 [Shimia abyssi]